MAVEHGDVSAHRFSLAVRPDDRLPEIDDERSRRALFLLAAVGWSVGIPAYVVVARSEGAAMGWALLVYLSFGAALIPMWIWSRRRERLPGILVTTAVIWASLIGIPSEFHAQMAPLVALALTTAAFSWFGTRYALVHGVAAIVASIVPLAVHGHPRLVSWVVGLVLGTGLAGVIVSSASDRAQAARSTLAALSARNAAEARRDPLTGLANRMVLDEFLDHWSATSVGERSGLDVFLIDLDGFKEVNDDAGHAVGDEILRTVAHRLQGLAGVDDLVVRLGGDEFVLVSASSSGSSASDRATFVEAAVRVPVTIDEVRHTLGASVGVAVVAPDSTEVVEAIRRADRDMYRVKRARRGGRVRPVEVRESTG